MIDEQLLGRAHHPVTAQRLLVEMANCLAFREARQIAALFARLLQQSPELFNDAEKAALMGQVKRYNAEALTSFRTS